MTIDLDTIEIIAKNATPGPWREDLAGHVKRVNNNESIVIVTKRYNNTFVPTLEDSTYIASVNPSVVLEMITEIRKYQKLISKLKAERDWLADTLAGYCSHTTGDEQENCVISPCPNTTQNRC